MRFLTFLAAGLPSVLAVAVPRSSAPSSSYWLDQMDHTGAGKGVAPFANDASYTVYRNVNTGYGGDIQKAIDDGSRAGTVTTKPAQVFIPGGTYTLQSTLNLRMGTIVMGDPNNPPVLKAAPGFSGSILVNGYDNSTGHPEDSFFTQLRNVVIDTTAATTSNNIIALEWGVAQGCALGNVDINLRNGKDIGIDLNGGSTVAVTDVNINYGSIGIQNTNQQVNFKNINFKGCTTAYVPKGGWTSLLQGVTFNSCGIGIDMTKGGSAGDVILLDSVSTNSGVTIYFTDSSTAHGDRNNQVVIQNLKHDTNNDIAVASYKTVLKATSSVDTWIYGNDVPGQYKTGSTVTSQRPNSLLNGDGQFFMMNAPLFNVSASEVVNVKTVSGQAVHGDGKTDDSAALNAILADNAKNNKVTYFPYGVYILADTLYIPPGSRIVGEAWPVLSGSGTKFGDAKNPVAVVAVGHQGDTGVAQIVDMRFTVSGVLPGASIVEVNMAGSSPGDVGLWNTVVTIGGTADSAVSTSCQAQDTTDCMAAWAGVHLTSSSSAYVQNMWVWTADHDLDGGPNQIISTGRGILVEATKGTWLVGTASEHNWLYNYNLHGAANVFAGMQQTETPYMQGDGATKLAPAPWTADTRFGDPDFSWCGASDGKCRSSLAQNVDGGDNIFLYSSANWAFFNGPWDGKYDKPCAGSCQTNMNRIANGPKTLTWYGVNTKSADVMILDGASNPPQAYNPGSWGGNLVAYRQWA